MAISGYSELTQRRRSDWLPKGRFAPHDSGAMLIDIEEGRVSAGVGKLARSRFGAPPDRPAF